MHTEFFTTKLVENEKVGDLIKYKVWNAKHEFTEAGYTLIKTGKYNDSNLIEDIKPELGNGTGLKVDQGKKRCSYIFTYCSRYNGRC